MKKACKQCNDIFFSWPSHNRIFCKNKCYAKWSKGKSMNTGKTHFKKGHVPWSKGKKGFQAAESHPNWKGGKTKRKDGYIYLNLNNKKYLEHRIIMEKYLGRKLKRKEVVHHINHKPSDNNIENLMLFRSQSDHLRIERAII